MKRSIRWFNQRSTQNTRTRIADLPILISTGPSAQINEERRVNEDGDEFFVVGESEVGGEEVVG